ncbi:MAG: thermonuclease family protein [Candidatus Pacearchaeota archaeon]
MRLIKILLFLLIFNSFLLMGVLFSTEEKYSEKNDLIIEEYCNATRILDGDTIETNLGIVRLLGINVPEKKERLYEEAKNFTSQLKDKEIILIKLKGYENKDRYGRLLRYVYYNNSLFNKLILEKGLAKIYYYKKDIYYEEMLKAEEEARKNKIGIWEESKNICKDCIKLEELNNKDPYEHIVLKNICNFPCDLNGWKIRDDSSSNKDILNLTLNPQEIIKISYNFSFWNDDKDSFYLIDKEGYLVIFYRYGYS